MNKSLVTNLIAGIIFLMTYASPPFSGQSHLIQASLFALSGALTNWLAIHMLFEKVPGLYGSGIIPLHFEEFKTGIRALIMDNFFTEENFKKLTEEVIPQEIPVEKITKQVNFDEVFEGLVTVIKSSPFGGMLGMIGGEEALEPLKEPFEKEFQFRLAQILSNVDISSIIDSGSSFKEFRPKVETMINQRLEELTPQQVKEIIDKMIREHLGWLVVWGGVFGGLIGIVSSVVLAGL